MPESRDPQRRQSRYPRRDPQQVAEDGRYKNERTRDDHRDSSDNNDIGARRRDDRQRYQDQNQEVQTRRSDRVSASRTSVPRTSSTSNTRSSTNRSRSNQQRSSSSTRQQPTRKRASYNEYDNPNVDHSVNVTQQSEAVIFFKLLAKIAFLIVFIFLLIHFSFRLLSPHIPYSFEERISQNFIDDIVPEKKAEYSKATDELQTLAEALAQHMNAPADMPLHIHISPDYDLNAYATLGGHIIINQGTIDSINSENALAMVLAHEIAHVKNRDAITGMGTGALFSLALMIVTGSDSGLTMIGSITELSFSRKQESDADQDALKAMRNYYGHTLGADEFFSNIKKREGSASPPTFLNSHPGTDNRLYRIRESQVVTGSVIDLTPLSPELKGIQNQRVRRSRR